MTKINRSEIIFLLTLGAVQFCHIVDFMIIMPLGPQLMRIFNISPREFGFLVSAYTISAGVSALLATSIADRYDRKYFIISLFVGFLIGTIACGFSPNYYWLLAARVATGAFGGIITGQTFALIGDLVKPEKRGAAVGFMSMSFAAASVIGVPMGLWCASLTDWHGPFFALGILGVPLLIALVNLVPSGVSKPQIQSSGILAILPVLKDSNSRKALAFMFLHIIGHFSIIPFIGPSLVSNVGFQENQLAYVYLFGGIGTLFSSQAFGRLTDKLGAANMYAVAVTLSLIPILALTHLPPVSLQLALVVTVSFFIVTNGRMVSSTTLVTGIVPPNLRGRFMSVNSAVQQFGMGIAALIGGMVVYRGTEGQILNYPEVGYIAIAANFACAILGKKIKFSY